MSTFIAVNGGGTITITPVAFSSADDFAVVIDGQSYSVTGTGAVNTTIDNWITAHAEAVSVNHRIYAADGATVLNLYNVDAVRFITSSGNTVGSRSEITAKATVDFRDATLVVASATVVAYLNEDISDSYDVATFTFASANEANRGYAEMNDRLRKVGMASSYQAQPLNVPSLVTFA